ncbi:MAG TPA: tail fiber domain-containing protein [Vampirovibrionales bacterium]
MAEQPFINQKDWGRDLLDRLGNFLDDDGAINSWDSLPSVGKDGAALGEQHKGYSGILKADKRSIWKWDGANWTIEMESPFVLEGKDTQSRRTLVSSNSTLTVLDEGLASDYFCIFESGPAIKLKRYSKVTGLLAWESTIPFLSGMLFSEPGTSDASGYVYGESFCIDFSNIYFTAREKAASTSTTGSLVLIAVRASDGVLLWKTPLLEAVSVSVLAFVAKGGGSLFVAFYLSNETKKINALSGAIQASGSMSGPSTGSIRKIFYDDSAQRVVFCSQRALVSVYLNVFDANLVSVATHELANTLGLSFNPDWNIFQDSLTFELYVWAKSSLTGNLLFYKYSISTNTLSLWSQLADPGLLSSSSPVLLGGKVASQSELLIAIRNLNVVSLISVKKDVEIKEQEVSALDGGDFNSTTISKILPLTTSGALDIWHTKQRVESFGIGSSFTSTALVITGKGSGKITKLKDSITVLGDAVIKASTNFSSFSAARGNVENLTTKTLALSAAAEVSSSAEKKQGAGLHVGALSPSVFSIEASSVANGFASKGYTGGESGRYLGGITWNGDLINGSLISRGSSFFPGIFLFDISINKFFLESGPQTTVNSPVASFPNGSGLVLSANSLGIGTQVPAYKLDVVGTIRGTTLMNSGGVVTSDERIKVGITPLDGVILWEICEELVAISYLYKPDVSFEVEEVFDDEDGNEVVTKTTQKWPLPQGIQYGWSAQQVREIFPELVNEDPQSGILYLNREALFPIIQAATTAKIKQLEESITQKDTLLTQLQSAIESLTARVEALENAG